MGQSQSNNFIKGDMAKNKIKCNKKGVYLRLEPGLEVLNESGGEDTVGIALRLHVLQHLCVELRERKRERCAAKIREKKKRKGEKTRTTS